MNYDMPMLDAFIPATYGFNPSISDTVTGILYPDTGNTDTGAGPTQNEWGYPGLDSNNG
jgi:hypothetical protein